MTFDEAKLKAREVWGEMGFAGYADKRSLAKNPKKNLIVGISISTVMGVRGYAEFGRGSTWEQAFRDAKKKRERQGITDEPNRLPYSSQNGVLLPENPDVKIRRYMTLGRLIYLLEEEKLWFSRMDKMNDDHEGAISEFNIEIRRAQYWDQLAKIPWALGKSPSEEKYLETMSKMHLGSRKCTFANCWQMSDYEDFNMWRSYVGERSDGVMIEPTFRNLILSFVHVFEHPIVCGKIIYEDRSVQPIDDSNMYKIFLSKRKEFESERELRALLWLSPYKNGILDYDKYDEVSGIEVPVNLKQLVNNIVVSPFSSNTMYEEVQRLTQAKGLSDPKRSSLSVKPNF